MNRKNLNIKTGVSVASPTSYSQPSRSHRHTKSLTAKSEANSSNQFHKRNTSVPVQAPSHKPPSTQHDFQGDIKAQSIFRDCIKKRNEKIRILFPGMDRFEMQRNDVWNHDIICNPSLIVQPRSVREVCDSLKGYSAAVHKCLTANKKAGARFAFAIPRLCVAGGRNSMNCMKEGAVVIDLSKMRSVKFNSENETVDIQGGARVVDVDVVLGEVGYMTPLPTSQHIGIVGSLLGGGLGYSSRKYGMTCDNVLAANIILADGRQKKCTREKDKELLWSICGGGGGIGIVVSLTVQCYPLRHAALLTFDMPTPDVQEKRNALRYWANWMNGDVDNEQLPSEMHLDSKQAAPCEVFSQILIPSSLKPLTFLGTSIDTNAINQTDGFIELYSNAEKKAKKKGIFKMFAGGSGSSVSEQSMHDWQEIPGLSELQSNKFSVSRKNVKFEMVRYADQLSSFSNDIYAPGNIFYSIKFCKTLTNQIIEVLLYASTGELSPKNESKIVVMSMGGNIKTNEQAKKKTAFTSRDMGYMIYIEGKWDAVSSHKLDLEKKKVKKWVHWINNKLHLCDGVRSSAYPESTLDMISKSGRSKPPRGWYIFSEHNGRKLRIIKHTRDPKNIFSFASRISWSRSASGPVDVDNDESTISTDIREADSVREGEIQPTDCLTPQKHVSNDERIEAALSADSGDAEDEEEEIEEFGSSNDEFDAIQPSATELTDPNAAYYEEDDNENDLVRILSLDNDDDDDLKEWSLAPVPLERSDFHSGSNEDDDSDFDEESIFTH